MCLATHNSTHKIFRQGFKFNTHTAHSNLGLVLGLSLGLFVVVMVITSIVVAGVCYYMGLCCRGTPRYRRLAIRVVTEDLNSTVPSSTIVCTDVSSTNVEVCVCVFVCVCVCVCGAECNFYKECTFN